MLPFFKIGSILIPSYAICIGLGLVTLYLISLRNARYFNLSAEDHFYCLILAAVGAFIGAKLLYIITVFPVLEFDFQDAFKIRQLLTDLFRYGLVIYGGIIGGMIVIRSYCKKYKLNGDKYLAAYAVAMPFAQAWGRLGCLLAGCCYGFPYTGPGAIAHQGFNQPVPIMRFPTQAVWLLGNVLFGVFLLLYMKLIGRRRNAAGRLIAAYVLGYALLRFIGEYMRGDLVRGIYGPLSQAQWLSILFFCYGIYLSIKARRS
ncbi:MAG: prolipoprotein diacylglyceryl transferase [Eubacteriales bacterium]|nr:prolipoprotein diacylglyceryl transferase [Eubacteriales bacterium]